MITNLHVKNLALIDEADVSFRPGLNILTGETGAGKSILLGSIDLALGQKMSSEAIRSGADHALVELVFEIDRPEVLDKLRALEVEPEEGVLVLSRKVSEGRSLCRLNGETCTAARLREISSLLLDIHGQHEHQSLLYPERQLEILDAYGKEELGSLPERTRAAYETWRAAAAEAGQYTIDAGARAREQSLIEYEIREIEEAGIRPGEDAELEKDYRRMSSGKKIVDSLQLVHRCTGEEGAAEPIGRALRELQHIAELDEELRAAAQSLTDIENLLADFNRELAARQESFSYSEEAFYETEKRLDRLNELKAKYGKTLEDVLSYLEDRVREREKMEHFEEQKAAAEAALRKAEQELDAVSEALSGKRKEIAERLSGEIIRELQDLNFLSTQFEIDFTRRETWHANGIDAITFRISTNPGEPLRPLSKVVSGGELSRIMLAIKCLLAEKDSTGTLLFDEIDTGVSGRTAQKVAEKMERIARSHQVLCVTHLAQLAAMADHHFCIHKEVEEEATITRIEELDEAASIEEIARILGGAEITDTVRSNAAEMRSLAKQRKQEV